MEDVFEKFREVVEERKKCGQNAQGEQAFYVPTPVLREHWEETNVREVLYATAERMHLLPIDVICQKYLQTFSIIVYISETARSYVRYMHWFIQHHRDDISLPLERKPSFLPPDSTDADDFFNSFRKHQWKFCPVSLGPSMIYDRRLDPRQVLPFCREGDPVSSKKIGRDTTVHCVKVDPSAGLKIPAPSHDLVMLKTFPAIAAPTYKSEIQAYTALNNSSDNENILRCLGCYNTQALDGNGRVYTIILENANRGTLLDLYKRNNPPIDSEETKTFWDELCKMVFGLEVIHHTPSDGLAGISCVHQDLKPSNIFVFSRQPEDESEFGMILKIGDFGMSHVRRSGSRGHNSLGYDSRSTRTYCPPEIDRGDDVEYRVGPLVDLWSMGCVLLEAAVWVAFGERGRVEFQRRRRGENEQRNTRQRSLGRGDSFHDGIRRLETVVNVANLIAQYGRKSDELTPAIVDMILQWVLIDERSRLNARQLSAELDRRIRMPRDKFNISARGPESVSSSTSYRSASQTSRDNRHSYGYEHSTQARILAHITSEPHWYTNSNHTPVSPSERGQAIPGFPMRTPSTGSYNNVDPVPEATDHSSPDLRSQYAANQIPSAHRPQLGTLPRTDPDLQYTARVRRQEALFGINDRDPQFPGGSKQPVNSSIFSAEDDKSLGKSRYLRPEAGYPLQIEQPATGDAFEVEPGSPARVQTTSSSNSTITPPRPRVQNQLLEEPRSIFAHCDLEEVNKRRLKHGSARNRPFLPGEDQAMHLLQKRDHLFLIDNSDSMQRHRNEVVDVFTNLAHILEKADDDGLDVIFTSSFRKKEHARRTANLVELVQENFPKGSANQCLIESSLDDLINKIIDDLPSGEGARKSMASKAMSRIRKGTRGRPISIYILTNGVWNPALEDGLCGADVPIRRLIIELKKRNLRRTQVAFQFIRFGHDAIGIKRLTYLDDTLGKEYPGFDIVDHKDVYGSVWPLLVGSLEEGTDAEESIPDGNGSSQYVSSTQITPSRLSLQKGYSNPTLPTLA